MKVYILFILLIHNLMAISVKEAATTLNAQTDISYAFKKAQKENKKLILLLIIKDGCHWCELMVNETMKNNSIKNALTDAIIVINNINSKLAKNLKAEHTPTMYFIDAKSKKILYEEVGFAKSGSFLISIVSTMEMIDEK